MKDIAQHLVPSDIVLDIGAYDCELQNHITVKEYKGVDLTPFKDGVLKVNVSYEKLPFKDKTFDKVVMSMLLSHIDNPLFALQEARRVMKDNGEVILVFSNIENINKLFQGLFLAKKLIQRPNYSYISVFGTQEIANILARSSFKVCGLKKRCAELFGYRLPFLDWTGLFSEYVLVVAEKSREVVPAWSYGKKFSNL
ncbi:class I SAM-dependent methyltransferase [Candidatus Woesearchaeota archaeon]|nr:class I SAM-dependent methyltransferase [Candidatus Woesearchaeota archaeon]